MRLVLPDCRAYADPFYLNPEQRRELILLIAEMGEAGVEEFIRRHQADDTNIARRVAKMRAKIMEEAAELRRRLYSQYDEKRREEHQRMERVLEQLRRDEKRILESEEKLGARLPRELEERVKALPIIEMAMKPSQRLAWYKRIWNTLRNLVAAFWHGLLWLLGRRRKPAKARAIAIGVPGASGPGVIVELDLEKALAANPDLRRRIRHHMGDSWGVRTRRMWRILLGIENYADVAQQIMEEEAKRAAEERSTELRKEIDHLEEERKRRQEEAKRSEEETKAELERLDRLEASERAQLEATLARRPLEDVKEIVEGELEASGLVQKIGDDLQVTGRFLETLAGIVYAEESRGIGHTAESPLGATIEGEGILERGPILSYYETSHMDTVASLLNARMHHPHVKHLLDEDVLVYRERRASLTHIVIVVDKSLSMEENQRMEAAKRACLALYWGVKRKSPQNKIDILLMDTSVARANLSQAWATKPGGFTNTGRAIEAARALLLSSRANNKLLFLVTDGLPEALTIEGKDVAGRPEEALSYAVRQAERLRDVKGLLTTIVLLEAKDPLFLKAGERLAKKARGKVIKVTPQELTRSLLVEMREAELAKAPAI